MGHGSVTLGTTSDPCPFSLALLPFLFRAPRKTAIPGPGFHQGKAICRKTPRRKHVSSHQCSLCRGSMTSVTHHSAMPTPESCRADCEKFLRTRKDKKRPSVTHRAATVLPLGKYEVHSLGTCSPSTGSIPHLPY